MGVNDMANRTIRKFNPGVLQSDAEVKQQFVVRRHEFNTVMDVLRGNLKSESCQHVLVVGPRGRGKTMLLARVAAELRTNDEFSAQMLPVRFTEESHEIFNAADFWLETLFHLARESESVDSSLASEIRESHSGLRRRWNDETVEGRALAAVLDLAGRLGRKLVLMVENLQSLSDAVDEPFGWKLRGALQTEPQIVLVGTATSRFKGLDDARQPFFELFRTVDLQPLSTSDCQALWQELSDDHSSQRKIRPLQILTGGNPRLLVIVAQFARFKSMGQLMEELVALVDEHTEYFRSHIEALSKTERRVYLAVIDLWYPVGSGEIADRAQMDIRVVSTMLKRLVDRGAVLVEGSDKRRRYSAVERLYCIYYKLRREHNESAIVQNLVRFMITFYSNSELIEFYFSFMEKDYQSVGVREGLDLLLDNILKRSINITQSIGTSINHLRIARLYLVQAARPSVSPDEGIALCDHVINGLTDYTDRQIGDLMVSTAFAQKIVLSHELGNLRAVNQIGEEFVQRFGHSDFREVRLIVAHTLQLQVVWNQLAGDLNTVIAISEWMNSHFGKSDDLELQDVMEDVLGCRVYAHDQLGQNELAIRACDEVIRRCIVQGSEHPSRVAWAYYCKINALRSVGDGEMMVDTCNEAMKVFEGFYGSFFSGLRAFFLAHTSLNFILSGDMESTLSDLSGALEALEHWPTSRFEFLIVPMRSLRLDLLRFQISNRFTLVRSEEILVACTELERDLNTSSLNHDSWFNWQAISARSAAFLSQNKREKAMDSFHSAYRFFVPSDERMLRDMLTLVTDLISNGASEAELLEALRTDVKKANALLPLIVALGERAGESFSVPVEIREVASDVGKDIEIAAIRNLLQKSDDSRDPPYQE